MQWHGSLLSSCAGPKLAPSRWCNLTSSGSKVPRSISHIACDVARALAMPDEPEHFRPARGAACVRFGAIHAPSSADHARRFRSVLARRGVTRRLARSVARFFPLDLAPADVAAAEAFREGDGVNRRIGQIARGLHAWPLGCHVQHAPAIGRQNAVAPKACRARVEYFGTVLPRLQRIPSIRPPFLGVPG